MDDDPEVLAQTRRSLHGVAELVLAGPQYAVAGTIRLRPTPGGFGTVAEPSLRVAGVHVLGPTGAAGLDGRTPAEVAHALGVEPRGLSDVYTDGPGVGLEEVLRVDDGAAARLAEVYALGDRILRAFAPGVVAVLWPEHLDLAVTVDEVTYGVSPGDAHHAEPYAYVSPSDASRRFGAFWNASFGAARSLAEPGDLGSFFEEGRARTAR